MSSSGFWKRFSPDRSFVMRIGVIVSMLVLVWSFPTPILAQDVQCGSYAVAVAPQQVGHPLSDDIVRLIDIDGELAEIPFEHPGKVIPTPNPNVALLRSLGGIHALLNTDVGEIQPLQIPENIQPLLSPNDESIQNATDSDFMLLAGKPGGIWLVDLIGGEALDLSTLVPGTGNVESATISPDGVTLLFYGQQMGYVVSLTEPGLPSPLSTEPVLPIPGFSKDGRAVVYAIGDADDMATVFEYHLDSGVSTEIGTAEGIVRTELHSGAPMWLVGEHTMSAMGSGDRTPTPIYTSVGTLADLIVGSAGRFVLVESENNGHTEWSRIEVESGMVQELPVLTGMQPLTRTSIQNAVIFFDPAAQGTGIPGAAYLSLDLITGDLVTLLQQDSSEVWSIQAASDDGRFAFVNAVSPGAGRMWLLDANDGSTSLIGTSTGNVSASLSPDGCQLATAIYDTIGEGRQSTVTVSSRSDNSVITTIPDALVLGWATIPSSPS